MSRATGVADCMMRMAARRRSAYETSPLGLRRVPKRLWRALRGERAAAGKVPSRLLRRDPAEERLRVVVGLRV